VFVDITADGETLDSEEMFGSVEAVKTVSELYMPVSGEILEVNDGLESAPENVNSDPYGDGWMIKIKLSNPGQVDALMDAETYKEMVGA